MINLRAYIILLLALCNISIRAEEQYGVSFQKNGLFRQHNAIKTCYSANNTKKSLLSTLIFEEIKKIMSIAFLFSVNLLLLHDKLKQINKDFQKYG